MVEGITKHAKTNAVCKYELGLYSQFEVLLITFNKERIRQGKPIVAVAIDKNECATDHGSLITNNGINTKLGRDRIKNSFSVHA